MIELWWKGGGGRGQRFYSHSWPAGRVKTDLGVFGVGPFEFFSSPAVGNVGCLGFEKDNIPDHVHWRF